MRGHGAEHETSPHRSGGFTPPSPVATRISHARPANLPIDEAGASRHREGASNRRGRIAFGPAEVARPTRNGAWTSCR